MSRWWRAYDEAVHDPKLQRLSPTLFRAWFNLCCLNSANGGTLPSSNDIAFKLRLSEARADEIITELSQAGLVDEVEGKRSMHNWSGRQYKSDLADPTAAERMRRYRNRHRNDRNGAVTVTVPRDRTEQNRGETPREIKSWAASKDDFRAAHQELKRSIDEAKQPSAPGSGGGRQDAEPDAASGRG